ncbi:MAG: adenosylcobinamide-GDP ribazoletransferase [Cypionkella sp.]
MTPARARLAELQLAVMMLTRLPAGRIAVAPHVGAAAWAFPLVGGVIGAISALILLMALACGVAPIMAAGLALGAGVLVTGGLHEDGLADVADGFGGGRGVARKLEIMRDSRIGSYGAVALVLAFGLRWQGLALMAGDPWAAAAALVALGAASRAGMAVALLVMPAARTDGMGKSAQGVGSLRAGVAVLLGVMALLALGCPVAVLVIACVQAGFGWIALRQIGGQSGDVLGAMQVLGEIAGWLILAR